MILVMLTSIIAVGCSSGNVDTTTEADKGNTSEQADVPDNDDQNRSSDLSLDAGLTAGKAAKLSTVKIADADSVNLTPGGAIYKLGDMYGVASLDGKHDTGAVYKYAVKESSISSFSDGSYTLVFTEPKDDGDVNICGMIDSSCTVVIEPKYAIVTRLSNRYIKLTTGYEITDNKDDALFYSSDDQFSFSADDDDTFYTGKWEIYDVEKKAVISGISGTKPYKIKAYGQYIEYTDDNKKKHVIDGDYNEVKESREYLEDGTYYITEGKTGQVFSNEGELLFGYSTEDYTIYGLTTDRSNIKVGKSGDTYFILDRTGKVISGKYPSTIYGSYPDMICSGDQIYNYNGDVVLEGKWDALDYETYFGGAYYTYNDEYKVILDTQGNELFRYEKKDNSISSNRTFCLSKTGENNKKFCYNYADKDFTIEGETIGIWFAKTQVLGNLTFDVTDVRTGDVIIEGYKKYEALESSATNEYFIIAYPDSKDKNTFDVYQIK